jgi:hypothetical protein
LKNTEGKCTPIYFTLNVVIILTVMYGNYKQAMEKVGFAYLVKVIDYKSNVSNEVSEIKLLEGFRAAYDAGFSFSSVNN